MKSNYIVYLLIILYVSPVSILKAASLTYVASLTIEDTAGNIKTQLERTTLNNCKDRLKTIKKAAEKQPGITRIVSSKCGEIAALIGYFERKSMGVPYVIIGENSVLILRGANERICSNLALLLRKSSGYSSSCIFPTKIYK